MNHGDSRDYSLEGLPIRTESAFHLDGSVRVDRWADSRISGHVANQADVSRTCGDRFLVYLPSGLLPEEFGHAPCSDGPLFVRACPYFAGYGVTDLLV